MNDHLPRFKPYPLISDTVGFFKASVPITNQSAGYSKQVIKQYGNFSIYDYQTPSVRSLELKPIPSIFSSHQLQPVSHGPKPIHQPSIDWVTGLVFVCLLILAWIQTNHSKRLTQIIRSVALPYYVNQLEREGNLYNERITLGLGFIFLTSIALMIYKFSVIYGYVPDQFPSYVFYLFILTIVVAYVILKGLVIRATGSIFKTWEHAHAYRLNTLIFNHTLGLVIFPFLLLIFYWKDLPLFWIAFALMTILLSYRFIRSILIGFSNSKFSIFHLILYLCTLEILPLLIVVKIIRHL
ncbi:MAG: DUF4271 domain-containing protein [Bacteroidales bacterium]|nr:DUF4271 domain-containing protein [Bacteroidales bacterium]